MLLKNICPVIELVGGSELIVKTFPRVNKNVIKQKNTVLELVGGAGPHEGNIMISGRPVCDHGRNPENAEVICRYKYHTLHLTPPNINCRVSYGESTSYHCLPDIFMSYHCLPDIFLTPGNLATLVATSQPGPTLAQSQRTTLQWTTFTAMVPRGTSGDARMRIQSIEQSIAPGRKAWGWSALEVILSFSDPTARIANSYFSCASSQKSRVSFPQISQTWFLYFWHLTLISFWDSLYCSAWVTWPEWPKGAKEKCQMLIRLNLLSESISGVSPVFVCICVRLEIIQHVSSQNQDQNQDQTQS